jgi:hypothetical protein
MDERPDAYSDGYGARIGRVKPVMSGRSIALPPIAPIVGVLGLLLGLVAGFGLAPTATPTITPGPTVIGAASPSFEAAPSIDSIDVSVGAGPTFELPPPNGLTLAKALEGLGTRLTPEAPEVVSARVARWTEVWASPAAPPDIWVWAITVRGAVPFWCRRAPASESASPVPVQSPPYPCSGGTTEMFVFDYLTGDFLEAMSPARP